MAVEIDSLRSNCIGKGPIGNKEDDKRGKDAMGNTLEEFNFVEEEILVSRGVQERITG